MRRSTSMRIALSAAACVLGGCPLGFEAEGLRDRGVLESPDRAMHDADDTGARDSGEHSDGGELDGDQLDTGERDGGVHADAETDGGDGGDLDGGDLDGDLDSGPRDTGASDARERPLDLDPNHQPPTDALPAMSADRFDPGWVRPDANPADLDAGSDRDPDATAEPWDAGGPFDAQLDRDETGERSDVAPGDVDPLGRSDVEQRDGGEYDGAIDNGRDT